MNRHLNTIQWIGTALYVLVKACPLTLWKQKESATQVLFYSHFADQHLAVGLYKRSKPHVSVYINTTLRRFKETSIRTHDIWYYANIFSCIHMRTFRLLCQHRHFCFLWGRTECNLALRFCCSATEQCSVGDVAVGRSLPEELYTANRNT